MRVLLRQRPFCGCHLFTKNLKVQLAGIAGIYFFLVCWYEQEALTRQVDHEEHRRNELSSSKFPRNASLAIVGSTLMNSTAKRRLPQAIIIGAKKAGTRALLEFIGSHPDVMVAGPEVHFFDKHYCKGIEWYRYQMPKSLPHQITMEKTPNYFVTKEVPRRIQRMNRNIKLILVLRNPVSRALSEFAQSTAIKNISKSFEKMVFLNGSTIVNTRWSIIRHGMYALHMKKWKRVFPLSQIHLVNGEQLITNPGAELAKVQKFLALPLVIGQSNFVFNSTKGFPCLLKHNSRVHCFNKSKGRKHQKVDSYVIQLLRDFYKPFNQKLYEMTGVDFDWL